VRQARDHPPSRVRRWSRRATITIVVLVLLLVGVRAALPHVILHYANRTLAEIPDYHGVIADVDLAIWRGAYQIEGLDIVKTDGEVPVPFFSCPEIDFSVEWKALFDGALVGEIDFRRPVVNLVAGPTEEETQTPVDSRWQDKIQELFPLEINRFEVHDGTLHYRDFHSTPKVDVPIDDVHVLATNLTNSRDLSETLVAKIEAEGRPLGDARLDFDVDVDPYAKHPTFDLRAKLENVDLRELNDFLHAYGGFDAEQGTLGIYSELAASDGAFTGYVKPLILDLDIVDFEKDEGPLQVAWEGLVAAVSLIFRNLPRNQFGTKVEFSGRFDQPEYSVWSVIGQIFRNAFIQALSPSLEGEVDLGDARKAEREQGDGESTEELDEGEPESATEEEDAALTGALGADLDDGEADEESEPSPRDEADTDGDDTD
jgi:hypothetical protein